MGKPKALSTTEAPSDDDDKDSKSKGKDDSTDSKDKDDDAVQLSDLISPSKTKGILLNFFY